LFSKGEGEKPDQEEVAKAWLSGEMQRAAEGYDIEDGAEIADPVSSNDPKPIV